MTSSLTETEFLLSSGKTQIKEFSITAAANAGLTTIATVTDQACLIKSIVPVSNGATTADLTSAAVKGGASQVVEFISAAVAIQADLDAVDKQVEFTGARRLSATKTIVMDLQGTGVTPVDFTVAIEYEAIVDGGYLA